MGREWEVLDSEIKGGAVFIKWNKLGQYSMIAFEGGKAEKVFEMVWGSEWRQVVSAITCLNHACINCSPTPLRAWLRHVE